MLKTFILSLLINVITPPTLAQTNVFKAISDAEKTVFSITTYNRAGGVIGKGSGFFISAIGLAVCPASIFVNADSIKIFDPRNQKLHIERVVAVHQPADMAIIKITSDQRLRFDFLFPTTTLFHEDEELLVFSNPDLGSDGAQLEKISKVIDKPFYNRIGVLNSNLGVTSMGAPVINAKGELVGVMGFLKPESPSFMFNCAVLSDSNWINLNVPLKKLKESVLKQAFMTPNLSKGILSITFEDWIGAAKNLTSHLQVFNNSAMCYALRGYARYMYNNIEESKIDFKTARTLSSNSFLTYYYEALVAIKQDDKAQAYLLADSSVYFQTKFPPSRVLRGNLALETNRPPNDALLDYSYAIQTDPNYAEAYYRRCLFLRKYTKNFELAYSDAAQVITLNPSFPNAYLIKGQMDMENENYFEAQKNLNNAVRKNPTNDVALYARGVVNYRLGLRNEARLDWKKASDLGNEKAMSYLLKYNDPNDK